MKIVFAASEAAPFIKTGGLGDVAGALPCALSEYKGNEILLFVPYYASVKNDVTLNVERVAELETDLSWRKAYVGLMRLKSKKRKLVLAKNNIWTQRFLCQAYGNRFSAQVS